MVVIDFLIRLGIKELSIWDGDQFEESNLNRQLYCTLETIGQNKAQATMNQIMLVNDQVIYHVYDHHFDIQDISNAAHCDCLILCADHNSNWLEYRAAVRQLIEKGIPVIDEAATTYGTFVRLITKSCIDLYDQQTQEEAPYVNIEVNISQPAYLCAMAAAISVAEMVKYFSYRMIPAIGQNLLLDLDQL